MIRISLIVALVAGLAGAGLNFIVVHKKVSTVVNERDTERGLKEQALGDLATARTDLDKATAKLKQTEETLDSVTTERDSAVAEAAKQTQKAAELATALEKTTQERDEARADLAAFKASGFTADQLAGLSKQMKQLQDTIEVVNEEKKILQRKLTRAETELDRYIVKDFHGPSLRADLKGKVLVADPKWDFVVLNVGENQGVLEWGELLVSRNGKLVAKVRVRTVEKDRSIANVMPGWALGDVMEGDEVIPAYPAS
jgi:flagellar biosynthesis chaperone FliJ